MSKVLKKERPVLSGEKMTNVYLSQRAIYDQSGHDLSETYIPLSKYTDPRISGIEEQPTSGFHNSFYRGKDITDRYTDGSLYTDIQNGFRDLYVGDFFSVAMPQGYTKSCHLAKLPSDAESTRTIRCRIAGFQIYPNSSDTSIKHIIVTPDEAFFTNADNTEPLLRLSGTTYPMNGFTDSNAWVYGVPALDTTLTGLFGTHLMSLTDYLTIEIDMDCQNAASPLAYGVPIMMEAKTSKCMPLSEVEVFGTRISSSGAMNFELTKTQLPLFRLDPSKRKCKASYWLKDQTSGIETCVVSSAANESSVGKINTELAGFRPKWALC